MFQNPKIVLDEPEVPKIQCFKIPKLEVLDQPAPHPPLHHHPAANSIDVPGTDVVGPQEMDRAQENRSQECISTFVNLNL